MSSPYINTKISTIATLSPAQMDNNLYNHLKENLVTKLEGHCYRDYGYIVKIYEITERRNGVIVAENPMAAASFDIKFSCRVCNPLKKKQIVCKVEKINKLLASLVNGPIRVIVTMDRINKNVFFIDQNRNLRYRNEDKSNELKAGEFVKVTILSKTFNDMDTYIMALGYLENIATDEEIKNFYSEEYDQKNGKMIEFDDYVKQEEDVIEIVNDIDESKGEDEGTSKKRKTKS